LHGLSEIGAARLRQRAGAGARCRQARSPIVQEARNDTCEGSAMSKTIVAPRTKTKTKTQRPPLYKVILLNDDYTPREFVVLVLKAVFRMSGDQAYRVMMTAHQRGVCVIAVYTRDVAETKAKEATELGKSKGYPLFFTTEPEQ
jgi:ATP-dependent Clp protease adaptor protein ClpS